MTSRNYKFLDERGFMSTRNQNNDFAYSSKIDQGSKPIGNWKLRNSNFDQNPKQDASQPHTQKPSKSAQYSFLRKTIDYPGAHYQPSQFETGKNHQFHSNRLRSTYYPREQPYAYEKPQYNYEKYSKGQKQRELNFLTRYQNQKNKKLKSFTDLHDNDKPINQQDHYQYAPNKGVFSPRNRARTQGEDYINQHNKNVIPNRNSNYEEKNVETKKFEDNRKFTKKQTFECYTPKVDYDVDITPSRRPSNTTTPFSSKYLAYKSQKRQDRQVMDKRSPTNKNQLFQKETYSPTARTSASTKGFSLGIQKVSQKGVSIDDFYLGEKLGEGRYGNVYKVFHKQTGAVFALKKLKKDQIKQHNMILQIKMQLMFNHPTILKLYGFFHDTQYLYLILQFMPSKTLFSYLKQRGKLQEKDASDKMRQILQAIHYLHENKIAHRDLKPQNIVMCDDICKLCDFGSSAVFVDRRKTIVGTPDYACPQVLIGQEYGIQIDYWCIGVLCYELLIGKAPFYHHRVKQTFKKIMNVDKTELVFPETISDQAIDFISRLLVKNPDDRMGTDEALEHPFITMYMDEQERV